jgi:hypothetical protein
MIFALKELAWSIGVRATLIAVSANLSAAS